MYKVIPLILCFADHKKEILIYHGAGYFLPARIKKKSKKKT